MNKKLETLLKKVTAKKEQIDRHRPLEKALLKNLYDWLKVELTYSSNAIEGNTLTKSETALVVEKGLTIGGKSLREHLEAINHAEAFDYILSLAHKTKDDISLKTIKEIHWLILRKIDDQNAGKLRTINVKVAGSDFNFPEAIHVLDLMENFINWLHSTQEHPVLIAADAHLKLVTIHPFVDVNGRTARLVMNLLLIQAGYPPTIIKPENRKEYIDSLILAQTQTDPNPFYCFIINAVNESLDMYLKQIGPKS